MLNEIEVLISDLKWEIKDRKANYRRADDLKSVVRRLESIVSNEREHLAIDNISEDEDE